MESALGIARTAPRALVEGGRRFLSALVAELPKSVRRQKTVLALILVGGAATAVRRLRRIAAQLRVRT